MTVNLRCRPGSASSNASTDPVKPIERLQPDKVSEGQADHGRNSGQPPSDFELAPTLNEDTLQRLITLIDEVTDQLMQDKSVDRGTCRADAITLLIDAARQSEATSAEGESPLTYLLLEEQQKAQAALPKADDGMTLPGFIRA